jgi:hypothetical protein
MLHEIKTLLSEPAVLAIVNVKCAVADIGVEWHAQTLRMEAVDAHGLP